MAVNPTIWWVRLHSKVAPLTASLIIGRSRHTFFRSATNKNGEIYEVHIHLSQLFSLLVNPISTGGGVESTQRFLKQQLLKKNFPITPPKTPM